MIFTLQKTWKTVTPSEGLQGTIKKDYTLDLGTLSFSPRIIRNNAWNKLWTDSFVKPENMQNATMS